MRLPSVSDDISGIASVSTVAPAAIAAKSMVTVLRSRASVRNEIMTVAL
jgi:hypothetical protein